MAQVNYNYDQNELLQKYNNYQKKIGQVINIREYDHNRNRVLKLTKKIAIKSIETITVMLMGTAIVFMFHYLGKF